MGRSVRKPDFATKVSTITGPTAGIDDAAIYIGTVNTEGAGVIEVIPSGNTTAVSFSGLSSGSFLPVLCKEIVSATDIDYANILLIK